MIKQHSSHLFSFFTSDPIPVLLPPEEEYICKDEYVVNRISRIVRLRVGEECVLFNKKFSIRIQINSFRKSEIRVVILEKKPVTPINPPLTLAIGLLKKEALEQVVSYAATCGVRSILPLISSVSSRKEIQISEKERLERIMIATCELSRQYAIPQLLSPQTIEEFVEDYKESTDIFFLADEKGDLFPSISQAVSPDKSITCIVGGEAGFTTQEQETLSSLDPLYRIRLTSSTLQAKEAAFLLCGILRSII